MKKLYEVSDGELLQRLVWEATMLTREQRVEVLRRVARNMVGTNQERVALDIAELLEQKRRPS